MGTTVILMSDIHGNLPALQTVAASLPPADAVYVAGDLCLEGPEPSAVVDVIRERGWQAVMGNTDADVVSGVEDKEGLVAWTRETLGAERLDWLASLPFSLTFDRDGAAAIQIVHANPLNLEDHIWPEMTREQLQPYLDAVTAPILAFGHTHIQFLRPVDGTLLADVSSVGHPRDRDRRAAYTIVRWDGERRTVEEVRIPYDIDETLRLMETSGMPDAADAGRALLRASYRNR
ncbi:MAG TPA: metallophosphoesterase family protein [Chloroflexota bacterium]|nr:metallophosphoesterase family protein [Chloroflexota bacterium]